MAKRPVPLYDFKAFGAAIKAARNEYGESRKKPAENKQTAKAVCYLSRYSYSTVYLLTRDVATPLLHCTGISVGNLE